MTNNAGEIDDLNAVIPMRPRLLDQTLDRQFETDGFVIIPRGARSALAALRKVHRKVDPHVPAGFASTLYSSDVHLKRLVHQEMLRVMKPVLDAHLDDHEPLLANFVTKGRHPDGAMSPHQDWTFVDERTSASWNVWIPLIDVDHKNGAMSVLPGGHRLPFTLRGTNTDNSFDAIEEHAKSLMVELPMRAGDILVHDHRVLHSSPPNLRRRPRVVAGCAIIAAGASTIHFRQPRPGVMERYEIEPRFFTEHTFNAPEFPDCVRLTDVIEFSNPVLSTDDLVPSIEQQR